MKKLNKNWIILPYNSISKTRYNNFFKSPRIGFLKFNSKKLNYRSYIMNSIYSLKMVLLNFQNYAVIMFLWRQIVICFMDFSAIRIYVISLTIFCSDLSTVKSLFSLLEDYTLNLLSLYIFYGLLLGYCFYVWCILSVCDCSAIDYWFILWVIFLLL